MIAICPPGPPKLMNPSFSQNRNASAKLGRGMLVASLRSPVADMRWSIAGSRRNSSLG